jgi:hypothetical protein
MFLQVQGTLEDHSNLLTDKPMLLEMKTDLTDLIAAIKDLTDNVRDTTLGITEQKNRYKKLVADKSAVLSGALQALAAIQDDEDLAAKAKVTVSEVQNARDQQVPALVDEVINLSRAHLDALAQLGVSEAQIDELDSTLDVYLPLVGQARKRMNKAHTARKELSELFDEANTLLNNKLDKGMQLFKFTNPTFFEEYNRARVIVDH